MAILTWRNVDAPNLAGAALAVGESGRNIGGAFNDLATSLGQFGQAQTDRADAGALQAASQITDSGAYAKALQDGSILRNAGIDPSQVSIAGSKALADRQKELLSQDFNRAQIANQEQDNDLALKKFNAEQEQAKLTNEINQYGFGRTKQADQFADQEAADQRAARDAAFQATQKSLTNADARDFITSSGMSPRAQQIALGSLNLGGSLMNLPAPTPSDLSTTGSNAYYGNGLYGSPSKNIEDMTMGESYDYGEELRKNTVGKINAFDKEGNPLGTSAKGSLQFTNETMLDYGPKVFGEKWREVPFNTENQLKMGEALFNDRKQGDLTKTWTGLKDSRPGAYAGYSYDDFLREVLPRESNTTLDDLRSADVTKRATNTLSTAPAVLEGMQGGAVQRLGDIDILAYNKDSKKGDNNSSKAAVKAIEEYPSLKGLDSGRVGEYLEEIRKAAAAKETPISMAQAVHVLGASMRPDKGFFDFGYGNGSDSGYLFDEDRMNKILQNVTSGGLISEGIVQRQIGDDMGTYNAAAAELATAQKTMEQIRQRQAEGLNVPASTRDAATRALNKALERHEALTARFRSEPYQQKLSLSAAEIADRERALFDEAARTITIPTARTNTSTPAGLAYSPATAISTGLPNRAADILQQKYGQ